MYMYVHFCVSSKPTLIISLTPGGALFGVFGSYTNRWGREPIIFLGFICHILCYMMTYFFLPEEGIFNDVLPKDCHGALGAFGLLSK